MKYQELYIDYRRLLDEEMRLCGELAELPTGHLTAKQISGKEYQYLQYSVGGKKQGRPSLIPTHLYPGTE